MHRGRGYCLSGTLENRQTLEGTAKSAIASVHRQSLSENAVPSRDIKIRSALIQIRTFAVSVGQV
jgi:hypothetical protein